MNRIALLFIAIILTLPVHGQALNPQVDDETEDVGGSHRDFRSFIREGNRHFNSQRAGDAEISYNRALMIDEQSDIARYNYANSLYRQNRFADAASEFEKVVATATDDMSRAHAYHNLGNSLLQQQKWEESIEAYRQALRNNPNDFDTKYNLSYAMSMLQQDDNQDNDNDDDDCNQCNQCDKCNQDQNEDENDDQDQDNQNQDGQDQQDPQDQRNDDTQQQQQEQQISPEDAQRILDAIAEDEKELLERLQQQERAGRRNIERNW